MRKLGLSPRIDSDTKNEVSTATGQAAITESPFEEAKGHSHQACSAPVK